MLEVRTRDEAKNNPLPLDRWEKCGRQILIHFLWNGNVYFGEIAADGTSMLGGGRLPVDTFREQVDLEGAEYLGGPHA